MNLDMRDSHTSIPSRPDLARLGLGIIGIGVSGPLIAMSQMPILTLIALRNLGGAIITAPFAVKNKASREGVIWSVVAGFVLAAHFVGFFMAMRMTSVAAGTAIVALQPLFAALYVKIAGGAIPSQVWIGMLIAFTGVVLISGVDLHLSTRSFVGDVASLISAALAALYMMLGSQAQRTIATSVYTTICYATCGMTSLIASMVLGFQILHFSAREWWLLVALIVGAQLLGHTMFNSALKRVSPAIVSLIIFFEVPVSALLAAWWMGQIPPLGTIPGIALILVGCTVVVIKGRK